MSGAQHTPGPWQVDGCQIVATPGTVALALYGDLESVEQTDANARLIAAAPDLVDACRFFTEAAHAVRDELNKRGIACPALIALAAEKARNALAKAEDGT